MSIEPLQSRCEPTRLTPDSEHDIIEPHFEHDPEAEVEALEHTDTHSSHGQSFRKHKDMYQSTPDMKALLRANGSNPSPSPGTATHTAHGK